MITINHNQNKNIMNAICTMSTKEIHKRFSHIMEASFHAKSTCLQQFGVEILGVAGAEYYRDDSNLPDAMNYSTVIFNIQDGAGQPLVGHRSVFELIENINAVSMWFRLESGTVVESGYLPVEAWFTTYSQFYKELVSHVETYPSRHLSSVA